MGPNARRRGAAHSRTASSTRGHCQQITVRMADELWPAACVSGHTVVRPRRATRRRCRRGQLRTAAVIDGQVGRRGYSAGTPRRAIAFDPALPAEATRCWRRTGRRASEKGLRRLRETVLAHQRTVPGRPSPTRGRCSSHSTSAPADDGPGNPAGFHRCAHALTSLSAADQPPSAQARRLRYASSAMQRCHLIDYVDHCWDTKFAPGGPTAAVPPGSWTPYGPWLRAPVDGILWAGTETADI